MVPWVANKAIFFPVDKKFKSLNEIIIPEDIAQKIPAIATVVNLGVSFLHLKLTENTANPTADNKPKIKPTNDVLILVSKAMIIIPIEAIAIVIQTLIEIFSFKNRNPSKAVIKGMAAKHKSVTAAEVFVIDHIKVIIAAPRPIPPTNPETPIFL